MNVEINRIEKRLIDLIRKPNKTQDEISEKERLRSLFGKALKENEKPLTEDLVKVGLKVTSCWDLVNKESSYPEAIPILIEHLSNPYHHKIKEGIIRALTVKEAKGKAGKKLLEEFNKTPKDSLDIPWLIGNAMTVVISREDIDGVIQIVKNKENGNSREHFVEALGNIKSEKSEKVLVDLLDEDELTLYALKALGRLKYQISNSKIMELLKHKDIEIQKEAKKALKSINKIRRK